MTAPLARLAPCFLVLSVALGPIATSTAAEVWVVTDRAHPVHAAPGIRVIELDAASRIEGELAAGLPGDATRAASLVQRRIESGGASLRRRLAAAYQGIADAWSAGVTKVPAVIVDRRYMVYGERNVERALREIERFRSATP